MNNGIKKKDSLYIARAIQADCGYFLTTDKKLLNKQLDKIVIINPLDFVRRLEVQDMKTDTLIRTEGMKALFRKPWYGGSRTIYYAYTKRTF